jgi:hypothetical protein
METWLIEHGEDARLIVFIWFLSGFPIHERFIGRRGLDEMSCCQNRCLC